MNILSASQYGDPPSVPRGARSDESTHCWHLHCRPADEHYVDLNTTPTSNDSPFLSYELHIARHARSQGMNLPTRNSSELRSVAQLTVDDWPNAPG